MTPIHDRGYRRYGGARAKGQQTWRVIARAGLAQRLGERRFLALMVIAWAPFLVRAVQIYVSANFAQASFLAPTADTFREFVDQQSLFVFFVTIYVGAGLIADDRRANALPLYLSRPLTRAEYVAGKLAILVLSLSAVTLLPALMLFLLQVLFAGTTSFLRTHLFLLPAIVLFSLVQVFLSALAMLALSSLSRSRRFVALMYAGIVFFTAAVSQVLSRISGSPAWALVSPEDTLDILADAIFGTAGRAPLSAWVAALVVCLSMAASLIVLERRVRAVEVVR